MTFALSVTDADVVAGASNVLTYSATGLPDGAALESTTGVFSWTPAENQDGAYTVRFSVDQTTYDDCRAAMEAILAEWTYSENAAVRRQSVGVGSTDRLNQDSLLATVLEEEAFGN